MALVQKTVTLSVMITVEYDDDVAEDEIGPDTPAKMADTLCCALNDMASSGDLFWGGNALEQSVSVVSCKCTNYKYYGAMVDM